MATTSPSHSDDKKSDPSYTAGLSVSSSPIDEVIGQETLPSSAKVEYSEIYLRARRKVDLRIIPLVLTQCVSPCVPSASAIVLTSIIWQVYYPTNRYPEYYQRRC